MKKNNVKNDSRRIDLTVKEKKEKEMKSSSAISARLIKSSSRPDFTSV